MRSKIAPIAFMFVLLMSTLYEAHAGLRKELNIKQVVNHSDLIVEGKITKVQDLSGAMKGTMKCTLKISKVLYGPGTLSHISILWNPTLPSSSREWNFSVGFRIGNEGTFFLKRVPRELISGFKALSRIYWNLTTTSRCLEQGQINPALDAFFVPVLEMFWPNVKANQRGTSHQAKEAELYRLIYKRLKKDSDALQSASKHCEENLRQIDVTLKNDLKFRETKNTH